VEDHPKWVILGDKARSLSSTLAVVEVVAEAAVNIAQSAETWRVQFGLANSVNPVGIALNIAVALTQTLAAAVSKVAKYRYEWQTTFKNLGTPKNFAYYGSSIGKYNYMKLLQQEGQSIRGVANAVALKEGFFTLTENVSGTPLTINNIDRERSLFLTLTDSYPFDLSDAGYNEYTSFDSNDVSYTSSQVLASEFSCIEGPTPETYRNIASPYVALKVYNPSQYKTINSVKWLYTGYTSDLGGSNCGFVLGGDIFISPHSVKRKIPMFKQTAFGLADLTPFAYELQPNVGKPKYYVNYEVNGETNIQSRIFPNIIYDLAFDCYSGNNGFYVEPPSKFYLYQYGHPVFFTETTVNTHYRNARKEPWNQYYPQNQDYINTTQEKTVSIRRPNTFFYNSNYSYQGTRIQEKTLPAYYSAELYTKQANNPNSTMYSLQDTSENSISEPWLNYRPLDSYTFPAAYGQLKRLKGLESLQVLGVFENISVVYNAVDTMVDGVTESNSELGTGGIFARRPRTFANTDLGYIGSQSHAVLSCEFGHFIVDAKRGQVFMLPPNVSPSGGNPQEISKYSGGKPNNMDVWFKEHLPFKILNYFPDFSDYIDNPYNGFGITMGWDSKFKRLFLTKKDYTPATGVTYNNDGTFTDLSGTYNIQESIEEGLLEDASWTITYKPEMGVWESYMSFTPNYYIDYPDYFQTGINQSRATLQGNDGLWSHLLTRRSKQVFYGEKHPWIIEYPTKSDYVDKGLEGITLWTEAKRYHSSHDFAVDDRITFNKVVIYNDRESSGNLNLVLNTGLLSQLSQYPITNSDTQDILISQKGTEYTFNHFFNRTKSNRNNRPLFTYDKNQIEKDVNTEAVSFHGKSVLEKMTGDQFLVRLTQDATSQFDIELKFTTQKEQIN
jgi:hypothetical protein